MGEVLFASVTAAGITALLPRGLGIGDAIIIVQPAGREVQAADDVKDDVCVYYGVSGISCQEEDGFYGVFARGNVYF